MNERMRLYVYFEVFGGPAAEGHGLGDDVAASHPVGAGGPTAAGTEARMRGINPVKRWVADAGCGDDLAPKNVVQTANLPVTGVADGGAVFHTANGKTDAVEVADVQVGELDEVVSP